MGQPEPGLSRCLWQLPRQQRDAVVLAAQAGVGYREVARRLGLTEAGARRCLRDGLRTLRELLDEVADGQAPATMSRARS